MFALHENKRTMLTTTVNNIEKGYKSHMYMTHEAPWMVMGEYAYNTLLHLEHNTEDDGLARK